MHVTVEIASPPVSHDLVEVHSAAAEEYKP
jgi:hypothetical protein